MNQQRATSARSTSSQGERVLEIQRQPDGSNASCRYRVNPGRHEVKRGEPVTWSNPPTDLVLLFPDKDLFGTREIDVPEGRSVTLEVSQRAQKGEYPYAVYCKDSNDFAEGNSYPVMIVR